MRFQGLKVYFAIAFFLVTTALILGGEYIFNNVRVDKPFTEDIKKTPGILSFNTVERNGLVDLNVKLGAVSNLKDTYNRLEKSMNERLGRHSGKIYLTDNRSEFLSKMYYDIHFLLEEAASQGDFSTMREKSMEYLSDKGMKYDLVVGRNNLYVSLEKNGRYLYEIIPRTDNIDPAMALQERA